MRAEPPDAHGEEEARAKVQAGHGGDRQLEPVVGPRVARARRRLLVQHVYEPVLGGQETRRRAAPERHDDEGDGVIQGDGAADTLEGARRCEGVHVHQEAHADTDVGVVDASERGHQAWHIIHDVSLEPELYIHPEQVFEVEDLDGVISRSFKDWQVPSNHSR